MSDEKKRVRQMFRDAVFTRCKGRCEVCAFQTKDLDAHHITSRDHMPNGGYVASNGIALCPLCHDRAEATYTAFFGGGLRHVGVPGWQRSLPSDTWIEYTPVKLYKLIEINYDRAFKESEALP